MGTASPSPPGGLEAELPLYFARSPSRKFLRTELLPVGHRKRSKFSHSPLVGGKAGCVAAARDIEYGQPRRDGHSIGSAGCRFAFSQSSRLC